MPADSWAAAPGQLVATSTELPSSQPRSAVTQQSVSGIRQSAASCPPYCYAGSDELSGGHLLLLGTFLCSNSKPLFSNNFHFHSLLNFSPVPTDDRIRGLQLFCQPIFNLLLFAKKGKARTGSELRDSSKPRSSSVQVRAGECSGRCSGCVSLVSI